MEIFKSDIHQSYIDKIKVKNNIILYNLKYYYRLKFNFINIQTIIIFIVITRIDGTTFCK